jgi:hypothetical protein
VPLSADGKYSSKVLPKFWLQIAWLWQEPLPSEQVVMMQICGQDYLNYVLEQAKQAGLQLPPS